MGAALELLDATLLPCRYRSWAGSNLTVALHAAAGASCHTWTLPSQAGGEVKATWKGWALTPAPGPPTASPGQRSRTSGTGVQLQDHSTQHRQHWVPCARFCPSGEQTSRVFCPGQPPEPGTRCCPAFPFPLPAAGALNAATNEAVGLVEYLTCPGSVAAPCQGVGGPL